MIWGNEPIRPRVDDHAPEPDTVVATQSKREDMETIWRRDKGGRGAVKDI